MRFDIGRATWLWSIFLIKLQAYKNNADKHSIPQDPRKSKIMLMEGSDSLSLWFGFNMKGGECHINWRVWFETITGCLLIARRQPVWQEIEGKGKNTRDENEQLLSREMEVVFISFYQYQTDYRIQHWPLCQYWSANKTSLRFSCHKENL